MPSDEEIRQSQRTAWAGLSAGWEKWDEIIVDQLAPVTDAMLEGLDVSDGQEHLDSASGTGEPGLTIARLVPHGHVVLTDISPEMLQVAKRRATIRGVANFDTVVCSADDLPFPDECFDSVSIRFGYMFVPDLNRATAEFARVLRPGGRLSASVWVKPEDNPWTGIVMTAIAEHVALPPPDPNGPGMFRCAAPGFVPALYDAAGLRDVTDTDVEVTLVTESAAQYWQLMSEHVSLAVAALRQADDDAREWIVHSVVGAVRAYETTDGRVRVPGLARCVVGTKE